MYRPKVMTANHRNREVAAINLASGGASSPGPKPSTEFESAGQIERRHIQSKKHDGQHLEPKCPVISVIIAPCR